MLKGLSLWGLEGPCSVLIIVVATVIVDVKTSQGRIAGGQLRWRLVSTE